MIVGFVGFTLPANVFSASAELILASREGFPALDQLAHLGFDGGQVVIRGGFSMSKS